MRAYGLRERLGVDALCAGVRGLEHLKVAPGKQRPGVGDVDRVARELHAVLGGSQRRGADALARRQQRPGQGARVEPAPERRPQEAAEVAEVSRLAAIDVLAHTA